MPVNNAVIRKVVIPETTSMGDSHSSEWRDIDQCSGTIAADIVQEGEEITASSIVSKDSEGLMEGLDGVKVGT